MGCYLVTVRVTMTSFVIFELRFFYLRWNPVLKSSTGDERSLTYILNVGEIYNSGLNRRPLVKYVKDVHINTYTDVQTRPFHLSAEACFLMVGCD